MSGLLLGGGSGDPNLGALAAAAARRGRPLLRCEIGPGLTPRITWDLAQDRLLIDGAPCAPTAAFLRQDVFFLEDDPRPAAGYRAEAWHATLSSWARAHPAVRLLNRRAAPAGKPEQLLLARQVGLAVPATWISNEGAALAAIAASGGVVKPVGGGGYCQPLAAVLAATELRGGVSAAPAIAQARLPGPDCRVYAVGARRFAFWLRSDHLDYRQDPAVQPEPLPAVPGSIAAGFDALIGRLGLDFAAADFKADAQGALVFLEVNNMPMFAAFDRALGGALADALLDWLVGDAVNLAG